VLQDALYCTAALWRCQLNKSKSYCFPIRSSDDEAAVCFNFHGQLMDGLGRLGCLPQDAL
jgi:hypothetical protein